MIAFHAVDAIELGQVLIQHREVGIDQRADGQILIDDVAQEGIGLLGHVPLDEAGVGGEASGVDGDQLLAVEPQPFVGEGADEGVDAGVVKQAIHLTAHLPIQQLSLGELEQFGVRRRVPEEVAQARGQSVLALLGLGEE